jgi:hypothetical protein
MEAVVSSETLVEDYQTTWGHMQEDVNLYVLKDERLWLL